MIQNRTATISIHGAAGTDQIIYLGGPPSTLRDEMETQLKSSGFTVMAPLDYIGGVKKNNFINREENNTGVQLELTTALRKASIMVIQVLRIVLMKVIDAADADIC